MGSWCGNAMQCGAEPEHVVPCSSAVAQYAMQPQPLSKRIDCISCLLLLKTQPEGKRVRIHSRDGLNSNISLLVRAEAD